MFPNFGDFSNPAREFDRLANRWIGQSAIPWHVHCMAVTFRRRTADRSTGSVLSGEVMSVVASSQGAQDGQ